MSHEDGISEEAISGNKLSQVLRKFFLGTGQVAVDQSRRAFLKKAATATAVGAVIATIPQVASARSEGIVKRLAAIPNDNQSAYPVEGYHFEKNEARALYEKVCREVGYDRFLYAVSEIYPLPDSFPENSAEIPLIDASSLGINAKEQIQVAELAGPALTELFTAANAAGFTPFLTSGFRSIQYQRNLFNRYVAEEMQQHGYSTEQAEAAVAKYSAIPGTSEHHLGTAFDVMAFAGQAWDDARVNFDQGFYKWIRENAHKFGFVISFPTGHSEHQAKETAAVVSAEPWHLRYVGKEVAEYFVRCHYLAPNTSATVHTLLIDPYFES